MRTKPYTARGIRRVCCAVKGCSNPGYTQWNACALNVKGQVTYHTVCAEHDVALNELAVRFFFGRACDKQLAAYRRKVLGA